MANETNESVISGLLAQAQSQGQKDVYTGKRRWARYTMGMRLEMTTDPTRPSAAWHATLHNISGGGIAVWSKRELDAGTSFYVSDGADRHTKAWLKATVQHCTVGLRGYLIGAAFDEPVSPEIVDHTKVDGADDDGGAQIEVVADGRSLRMKGALAGAAIAVGTTAVSCWILLDLPRQHIPVPPFVLALSAALLVGAVWGWVLLRKEAKFLQVLQKSMQRTAASFPDSSPLEEAPSREFGALRRAFLDLSARWRQREEDARIQRQKLEELTQIKSNILAIVSHDLRTPLTSILMYAQILLEDMESLSGDDRRNFLGIISDECTRLSRLVDDLLEVQRLESENVKWDLRSMDLGETIHSCVRVFAAMATSKSITLTVNRPETLPPVAADADKISQVLSNLVSNAIKYTQVNGQVEVTVQPRGHEIVLGVSDNGPGIPRDKWDLIFDRFAQLSDPNVGESNVGVGLGLCIVKKIVEGHGGAVWVDSEVGEGSTFYVTLPTVAPESRRHADAMATPARRVLVCDSDPEMAATIAQALRGDNLDVRVSHSGQRLLTQVEQGEVEVVVTDSILPDMARDDLLAALARTPHRSFRTIVHSYEGDARDLHRRGVDLFLKRPVSKEELVRAVHLALQKKSIGGLNVVIIDDGFIDLNRITEALAGSGHVGRRAATWKEAVAEAGDFVCDVLMISRRTLSVEEVDSRDLEPVTARGIRVIILNMAPRRNDRQFESVDGVTTVTYRPGRESELLEFLSASQERMTVGANA